MPKINYEIGEFAKSHKRSHIRKAIYVRGEILVKNRTHRGSPSENEKNSKKA